MCNPTEFGHRLRMLSLLLSIALLWQACSSGPNWQAPPAAEYLIPEITEDGSKFFTFRRDYLQAQIPRPGRDAQMDAGGNRGLRVGEYEVEDRLEAIRQRTGYCREGFFELYREQTFQQFTVRGECREDATDTDRLTFISEITLSGQI